MPSKHKICNVDTSKGIDLEKGIIPFVLTERVVDRDSEVIEPNGARIDNYVKNPVFLWAHDLRHPPIGKILPDSIKKSKQRLAADVQFDLNDPFAALIFDKYSKGYMNAGSIRFIPLTFGKEAVLPGQRGLTIKEWELLEFSAVPVPANQAALAQKDFLEGLDAQKETEDWLKTLKEFFLDDTFDHSPEGWVDKICKSKEKEQDDQARLFGEFCRELGMVPEDGTDTCTLEFESVEQLEKLEKLFDESEPFDPQKPYPNEHACRLKDPAQYIRIRRMSRTHNGKKYWALIGFKRGGGSEDQAYRYPKDIWSESEARAHCKDHGGTSFEPAKKEEARSLQYCIDTDNKIIEIEGCKYSFSLFQELGTDGMKTGQPFRIVSREDGSLDIEQICEVTLEEKAGRVLSAKTRKAIEEVIVALNKLLQADEPPKEIKLAPVDEDFTFNAAEIYAECPFAVGELFAHHNEKGEVVWKGVAKSMIDLLKGNNQLSEEQIKVAYEHLAEHYRQFEKEPPELELDFEIDETREMDDALIEQIADQIVEEVSSKLMEEN